MAIQLNKEESVFRNELIFAVDAKAVNVKNNEYMQKKASSFKRMPFCLSNKSFVCFGNIFC